MSESRVHVPKKWWWVVAVAVPLVGGALAVSPKLIAFFQDAPWSPSISGRVIIKESTIQAGNIVGGDLHEGDEVQTHIALTFGTITPGLSPEEREIVERAIDRLRNGDYEGAIPVLKAVAERAPTPSILNNLAAAHLAIGETAAARRIIDDARALESGTDLDVEAALNWNERRLAQVRTFGLDPITGVHASRREGIEAFLTRVEETGGLVTIEAIYRNVGTERVSFCPINPRVIDERADEDWGSRYSSHSISSCPLRLEPAASISVWYKFAFDVAEHPRVTVILPGVVPFENIRPAIGGGG